jgi:NAD(P)H-dependent FMN reductase
MAAPVRVLGFAGSTRAGSLNKRLVQVALAGAAEAGAETRFLDLADYRMPVYDGDEEARDGLPDAARALKREVAAHDALLVASPEYNGSLTAVLKNALDWISRPQEGEATLAAYDGKVAGLLSASPGALGGLRGLAHLRQILSGIRVLVIPEQYALARAGDAFDAEGRLTDADQDAATRRIGRRVAEVTAKIKA